MYPQVEQFETKEWRVAQEAQLLEELGKIRRSVGRPRRRRLIALRMPRQSRKAGCVAEQCC